jgi:hypothetical protein
MNSTKPRARSTFFREDTTWRRRRRRRRNERRGNERTGASQSGEEGEGNTGKAEPRRLCLSASDIIREFECQHHLLLPCLQLRAGEFPVARSRAEVRLGPLGVRLEGAGSTSELKRKAGRTLAGSAGWCEASLVGQTGVHKRQKRNSNSA